jgi:YVTN family beta-propeller protein
VAFLKRWIGEGARNDEGGVPFAGSTRRLYVCNQADDRVSILDIDALVVTRNVNVGTGPGNDAPHFVVSNESFWYVSLIGAREVWKFDAQSDTVIAKASIQGSPAILAITPDGSKLYVSQFMTSSTNSIDVINTATMTVSSTIPVWTMPHGMCINHAGTRLYVANMMSDNISVIDVETDQVVATIPLADDVNPFDPPRYMPMEVAVSPDDSLVAVSCSEMQQVRFFSATANALVDSVLVGDQPWHLEFSPDGEFCYVCNRRGNTVSVVHVPMGYAMTTISGEQAFAYPHGLDISADGRYTFASNENVNHRYVPRYHMEYVGTISVIDNLTNEVLKVLEVGEMPAGITIQD